MVGEHWLVRTLTERGVTAAADIKVTAGIGADDYLSKPLDPPRLVARVKAVLRRRSD